MSQWQSAAWTPDLRDDTEFMREWVRAQSRLGTSGFIELSFSHAFERTTLGLFSEETRIAQAEEKAGTYWNPTEQLDSDDAVTFDVSRLQTSHPYAMTEEAFKAAGFDRGGRIKWTPTTTPQRAEIEAETFDRRQRESRMLERSTDTWGRKIVGWGAALFANIPDPVNLIPIGGAAAKGATVGARAMRGAVEGVVSTAVADAVLLPAAARRGDDVDFADLALDLTFGALIGGGAGMVGDLLHQRRVTALGEEQTRLAKVLTEAGYEGADAGALAASTIAHIADMPHRAELAQAVRRSMVGTDRIGAGKLLDRMMIAIRDGENPDVGKWARELGADNAFTRAWQVIREQSELAAGYDQVLNHPLRGSADDVLARLEPEDIDQVLVHRGPAMEMDGEIVVQSRALKRATGSRRGYGMVKIIFGHGEKKNKTPEMPPVTRQDVLSLPRILREWESTDGAAEESGASVWRIPREDGNNLVIVASKGADGPDSRLVSMYVGDAGKHASLKKESSPNPSSRRATRDEDTGQGITISTPDGRGGKAEGLPSASRVDTQNAPVNGSAIDFTAPAPEPEIAPLPLDDAARRDSELFSADEMGALDMETTRIAEEGRLTPEEAMEMEAAKAELERVDKVENSALAVLECVLGGMK